MPPSIRSSVSPDSARAGATVGDLDALVSPSDRPLVDAHVGIVSAVPGPALLLWGAESTCLAYNRAFRTLSGLRLNATGKPIFRAMPELERGWMYKLSLALTGQAVAVDGAALSGGADIGGEQQLGWFVPVVAASDGAVHGVLAMFMDLGALLSPMQRLLTAVAHDIREPVIGIQVVSERLSRLPKPTRERCVEDMDRVLELTHQVDRVVDDLSVFARRSGAAGGAKLSLHMCDLGAAVKGACEKLNGGKEPPVQVKVVEAVGLWDEEAIDRIVTSLVRSARQHGSDGGKVEVELTTTREGAVLLIKDDGTPLRTEDAEQLFEPWKRGGAPAAERRRRGLGIGLLLARELVLAHGGRLAGERGPHGGFVVRVVFPMVGATTGGLPSSRR